MSHTHSTLGAASVTFVPLATDATGSERVPADVPGPDFAERLLDEQGARATDLAEYVRHAGPGNGGTAVLVTGCRRGDGCSTVAWALARAGAAHGSVLVVDGNLDRPALSEPIQSALTSGWTDVLDGRCPVQDVVREVAGRGFAFLPLRQAVEDRDAVLTHPALPLWLARLRHEFGLIVLDGGPVSDIGSRWARWVDSALLVCDPAQTPVRGRAEAWDALEAGGAQVLGIVETFV